MHRIALSLSLTLVLVIAPSTQAQVLSTAPPPPPVNQEGMRDFCIYRNELFSLGAQLCVPNANAGMRCVPGEGSKSAGRAYWSADNRDWPLAPDLRCGSAR